MPYLEHDKRLYRLLPGEHVLGHGEKCALSLRGVPDGPHAALRVTENEVTVRALGDGPPIRVNEQALGSRPRPLAHGDRIRVGKAEVLYIDETQVGGTLTAESAQVVRAIAEAEAERAETAEYADAGGTLTRRRDGSQFPIGAPLHRIGREAGCDLVVPESTVSRVHAEIRYQGGKYILHDRSTNGTSVNGQRVSHTHVLEPGDTLRIGSELFEFGCEKVPLTPAERARLEGTATPPALEATTERVRPRRRGRLWAFLLLLAVAGAAIAYFWL